MIGGIFKILTPNNKSCLFSFIIYILQLSKKDVRWEVWTFMAELKTEFDKPKNFGVALEISYPREGVDVSGLMATSQSPLVAFAIGSNVLLMAQPQFLDRFLDHTDPAFSSHRLGAEQKQKKEKTIMPNN